MHRRLTLRGLWRKWLKATLLDEYARIDVVKGQGGKGRVMTAVARTVRQSRRLCGNVQSGAGFPSDAFSRFMRAAGLDFKVAHDP